MLGEEAKAIDRQLAEANGTLAAKGVDARSVEMALDAIRDAVVRFSLADCSPAERAAILRYYIDRIEVHPERVDLWMYAPNPSGNAEPPACGRGFASIAGFGTPRRTGCKPVFVSISRDSAAPRWSSRGRRLGARAPVDQVFRRDV